MILVNTSFAKANTSKVITNYGIKEPGRVGVDEKIGTLKAINYRDKNVYLTIKDEEGKLVSYYASKESNADKSLKKFKIEQKVLVEFVLGTPSNNAFPFSRVTEISKIQEKNIQKQFETIAKDTVKAIKNKDFKKLTTLAHPKKGIVFSTTPYLVDGEYATLSTAQLKEYNAGKNEKKLVLWGIEGGSGEDIKLNFNDFYKNHLWTTDYLGKNITIKYGDIQTVGSDSVNYKEKFPNSVAVMYYYPGTNENGNMDWKAMIMVYQQEGKEIYLVAVLIAKFTP